ncbi:tetraspanin-19 [Podarcis raffonei]|uniref:tetraspanin-19 n=1 Tax=Podarcis raffonei TaxID=65483 RepID=UPI00232956A1|nr:tetraspanin-19 [Podarcis raffonei]
MKSKMRRSEKLFILKYFLNILNGIFLVLGLLLVTFGLWISLDRNRFFRLLLSTGGHSVADSVSHMLLAVGFIIVFIGLLGYLGSVRGNRCLVAVYMGLLVLGLVIQMAILGVLYTGKEMANDLWRVQMDELISNYGNKHLSAKEHQWTILNNIQRMLHCCGRYNSTDWKWNKNKDHANQVPCSCTTSNTKKWFCDALKNATYTRGCEEDIKTWYEQNTWLLLSINTGLLKVEVLQFVAAGWLFRTMRKNMVLPRN